MAEDSESESRPGSNPTFDLEERTAVYGESVTKKEFRYRISLCRRESRETKHWLRMMVAAIQDAKDEAGILWKEAHELTKIFAAIYRNSRPGD